MKSGRTHSVYYCNYKGCNKEFLRTCNLLDHCRMHNGVKPNLCEVCGKSFTQKSNLTKHFKTHLKPKLNDRKRYPCSQCSAAYTERYNLKVIKLLYFCVNLYDSLTNFKLCKLYYLILNFFFPALANQHLETSHKGTQRSRF